MCVMKLNKYFMIGAMGLSLVACSDNLDDNGQSANGTNPNEGTTYAALKINFNSSSSRATGDVPVDGDKDDQMYVTDAEGNEAMVKDVRIVVVDNNSNSVENVLTTVAQDAESNPVYVCEITPGQKTFYAVVNGEALGLGSELEDWDGGELTLNKKASELCGYNETATETPASSVMSK